jgi:hypothetical protein
MGGGKGSGFSFIIVCLAYLFMLLVVLSDYFIVFSCTSDFFRQAQGKWI